MFAGQRLCCWAFPPLRVPSLGPSLAPSLTPSLAVGEMHSRRRVGGLRGGFVEFHRTPGSETLSLMPTFLQAPDNHLSYLHEACRKKYGFCRAIDHYSPLRYCSRLTNFYRDASSALLQLVNQWLNFTCSRINAFRYGRQN